MINTNTHKTRGNDMTTRQTLNAQLSRCFHGEQYIEVIATTGGHFSGMVQALSKHYVKIGGVLLKKDDIVDFVQPKIATVNEGCDKKMYEIKYEVVGGKRTDTISFYSKSVLHAIKEFLSFEFDTQGIKFKYTEYSIISIN